MARNPAPLTHILQAYGITRIQLAAAAGADLKTIARLCRGDCLSMKIGTVCRVASALGVSASDLVPQLARPLRAAPSQSGSSLRQLRRARSPSGSRGRLAEGGDPASTPWTDQKSIPASLRRLFL